MSGKVVDANGFSLIELLLVLILIIIFLLIAVPGLSGFRQSNRTAVITHQLATAISFTRSHAISRHALMVLCGSQDQQHCDGQWQRGQIVQVDKDQEVLRRYSALLPGEHLIWHSNLGHNNQLAFTPSGFTAGQNGSFYYCPAAHPDQYGAVIVVTQSGRARIDYDTQKLQQGCGSY